MVQKHGRASARADFSKPLASESLQGVLWHRHVACIEQWRRVNGVIAVAVATRTCEAARTILTNRRVAANGILSLSSIIRRWANALGKDESTREGRVEACRTVFASTDACLVRPFALRAPLAIMLTMFRNEFPFLATCACFQRLRIVGASWADVAVRLADTFLVLSRHAVLARNGTLNIRKTVHRARGAEASPVLVEVFASCAIFTSCGCSSVRELSRPTSVASCRSSHILPMA